MGRFGKIKILRIKNNFYKLSNKDMTYHILNRFIEVFEKPLIKEIFDIKVDGRLTGIKIPFQYDSIKKSWINGNELKNYFDLLFRKFINKEINTVIINK